MMTPPLPPLPPTPPLPPLPPLPRDVDETELPVGRSSARQGQPPDRGPRDAGTSARHPGFRGREARV